MKADVAVDIGNSRIKWGLRPADGRRIGAVIALPDDPAAWQTQLAAWRGQGLLPQPASWVLTSVVPQRADRLRLWLQGQGERVAQLKLAAQLPLTVALERPDYVGIDRLLNAVVACKVLPASQPAVLVDAGSAVTVDWLDEAHAFRGGAIFPGLRLMAEALHQYTALLPLVSVALPVPEMPGPDTLSAMQVGIFWAVVGGIDRLVRRLRRLARAEPRLFFTGGDACLLLEALGRHGDEKLTALEPTLWPEQTLEGVLLAAEALP